MESRSLLFDVAIILAASFPLLFIGKRLRIPEVIAYLATGILIGPHALGWIRETHQVEQIAELGVALILFFIGLHIPFDKLRNMGRSTLVSGSLQITFTVLLVIVVGLFFRADPRRSSPGQFRVRLEIGDAETAYDTAGMTIQKQRSDLFRHWILGLGSGDLIVRTAGAQTHQFDMPNVLFLGRKVREIEDLLRSKQVVAGQ